MWCQCESLALTRGPRQAPLLPELWSCWSITNEASHVREVGQSCVLQAGACHRAQSLWFTLVFPLRKR